ncbi:MAG: hypothetical protein II192_05815 [Clostridia bacterium]|nr:hypothetical protein [Clostridia bacterium]
MKKVLSGLIAALAALLLVSCAGTADVPDAGTSDVPDTGASAPETDVPDPGAAPAFPPKDHSKLYVWEKPGFGGDFTITLNADGTYSYYAGYLSSYIGIGTWKSENGVLTMTENKKLCGNDNVFRFRVGDDGLRYIADGSSKFIYVNVQDGDRFQFFGETLVNQQDYIPDYSSASTLHADVFLEKLKRDGYHDGGKIKKDYNTNNIKRIRNITPPAVLEENPDLELFFTEDGYHCFLMVRGEIYRYDTVGGSHHLLVLWDYDGNGTKDLVSYHSWGSGVSYLSVTVTDLTTMEELPVITRMILREPAFRFTYNGESVFIDGKELTFSDGAFHCGDLF